MGTLDPRFALIESDGKVHHMKSVSVRDLRYNFSAVERTLKQGDTIEVTKRRRVIAKLVPVAPAKPKIPDFMARLRRIYGDRKMKVSNAELIALDRGHF